VELTWANPVTGPEPDSYVILRDGARVATIPGATRRYLVTGLALVTAYDFELVAVRGGISSLPSRPVRITTALPPLSAALLKWSGQVRDVVVKATTNSYIWEHASDLVDKWSITPDCATIDCDATLTGAIDSDPFRMNLIHKGQTWSGIATPEHTWFCVNPSDRVHTTLTLTLRVSAAAPVDDSWQAIRFNGSISWYIPPLANVCAADTFFLNFNSS
jgi:hypothetical protein